MPNPDLAHSQEKQTWRWASEELCVQSGEFPWWLRSGGGTQKVPAPLTTSHFPAAGVQLSHVLPFPWLLSGSLLAPSQDLLEVRLLSQPRELTPQKVSGEGESGSGEE